MAIEFHCNHCGQLVRTADEHAGKRGKCPACHQSVYIPTPSSDIEPLHLAPVDEEAERRQRREEAAARELIHQLRDERTVPPETARPTHAAPVGDVRLSVDWDAVVAEYVRAMSAGDLSKAESLASDIRSDLPRAQEAMDRLMMDELPPPDLAKIPRAVLLGFFKQLREPH